MKYDALGPITELMGRALKSLRDDGIPVDDRTIRLFVDRFTELWKRDVDDALKPH